MYVGHRMAWLLVVTGILAATGCGAKQGTTADVTASIEGGPAAEDDASGGAPPADVPPAVILDTSLGEITLELDRKLAPLTVDNFLSYVASGHYDQTILHQVIDGYVVLAGGYTSDLSEKPTLPPVRNEADNGLSNVRATIAMARDGGIIDSSTSQFFFNLADNTDLDHRGRTADDYGYCVFGKVIAGFDVVERIAKAPVHDADGFDQLPVEAVLIRSARRVR